jgi:DNA-binding helix-hairpin-helix protein with protein kinase domain
MANSKQLLRNITRRTKDQRLAKVDAWEQRRLAKEAAWREKKLRRLQSEFDMHQDRESRLHLGNISIESCDVAKIGDKTRATLRNHGVNTAQDLHDRRRRLKQIPGIDQSRSDQLRGWLRAQEDHLAARRKQERKQQARVAKEYELVPERYEQRVHQVRLIAAERRAAVLDDST